VEPHVTDEDYQRLLEFRVGLRRFLRWSETQAAVVGLTPAQHQLLLAIRGHPGPAGPTIGDVADALLLRHHSAVGLVDRAAAARLVRRRPDADDRRVVRLALTAAGSRRLARLTSAHLDELAELTTRLHPSWEGLAKRQAEPGRE
jgi:DNA-binding MarR family transcriptional regulator